MYVDKDEEKIVIQALEDLGYKLKYETPDLTEDIVASIRLRRVKALLLKLKRGPDMLTRQ